MNSRNTTKMVEHRLVLKKGETAFHCCDPALSVLVMLVSRNVFHIVSALQYVYRLNNFFLLIRSLVHPTLVALIVCGPLQFNSHSLMYFRAVGLSDPIRCVLKDGTGHAVKCLNV